MQPLGLIRAVLTSWCLLLCSIPVSADSLPQMLWSDRIANTIRRADVDGSNVELLVSGLGQARGVALDVENQIIYWNDNGRNKIQRRAVEGGPIEDLVTNGLSFPAGLDLDVAGGKMYWADRDTRKIQRADLDGANVEDLVVGLDDPYYVRLDLVNDHVYWTDFGTDKIQRANLDGTQIVDLVTTGLQLPRGIDLDLQNGKMYWADRGTDMIQRANLDGSQIETLHTILPPPGVDAAPHGVALDLDRGHVYWVDNGTVKIQRANLDGSNVVDILTAASGVLSKPWEIVLDFSTVVGPLLCDFNQDGFCDIEDINALSRVVAADTNELLFDLNDDLVVDLQDHAIWVHDLKSTYFGDANLNGEFNSGDLVSVFQAGQYEDGIPGNSGWAEGDWNADLEFGSGDLVRAFQEGSYEQGPQIDVRGVPEPAGSSGFLLGLIAWIVVQRSGWILYRTHDVDWQSDQSICPASRY